METWGAGGVLVHIASSFLSKHLLGGESTGVHPDAPDDLKGFHWSFWKGYCTLANHILRSHGPTSPTRG